jgi:hypothetical protein
LLPHVHHAPGEDADSPEIAMAMTAYFPFAKTRAGARGSRSKWRHLLDAMIEARRRKAEDEVARYLQRYWYQQASRLAPP